MSVLSVRGMRCGDCQRCSLTIYATVSVLFLRIPAGHPSAVLNIHTLLIVWVSSIGQALMSAIKDKLCNIYDNDSLGVLYRRRTVACIGATTAPSTGEIIHRHSGGGGWDLDTQHNCFQWQCGADLWLDEMIALNSLSPAELGLPIRLKWYCFRQLCECIV